MQRNVGMFDRALRVVLAAGSVAGSGVVGFSTAWGIVLLVVAAILGVTGISGFCPAYTLLGMDTLRHDKGEGGTGTPAETGGPAQRAA